MKPPEVKSTIGKWKAKTWERPWNVPTVQSREIAACRRPESQDVREPERKPRARGSAGASSRERLPRLSGNPAHWARSVPPATHRIRFPHNGAKSSGESLREGLTAGSVWWAFSEGPWERRNRKAPFTEAFLLPLPVTSWRLRTLEPPDFRLDLANQWCSRPPQEIAPPLRNFRACRCGRGLYLGCKGV